jgi:tRNA(fMet)-specific endonuclease VapC
LKYVLDTNTVSFLMRGEEAVVSRLESLARTDVLIPQPVIAEVEYGLSRLPKSRRRQRLRERFDRILDVLVRVEWTDSVSRAFGETKTILERRGLPLEDFDVAIAAHAMAHGATLVTDNVSQFGRISNLAIENWLNLSS